MQYEILADAILNSKLHTIPVKQDNFNGYLFVIVNDKMLYCNPNFNGLPLSQVCFEGEFKGKDYTHWQVSAPFTDDININVLIWASIVHNEILSSSTNKE